MSEKKRRCFVIGPIGKSGSPERKHADMLLNAVIREALRDSDPPYEIVRSDKVAEPGMINDHVIHDILNADLVVADLTLSNANAYYELGIRHAAEKPVINFAQIGTELPFDTFGYRAIMEDITSWDGIERARQQIRDAAKAIEAEGYRVSNPITQANASFRMRESADPTENVLGSVLARLDRLGRELSERQAPIIWTNPSIPPLGKGPYIFKQGTRQLVVFEIGSAPGVMEQQSPAVEAADDDSSESTSARKELS
jgi:hypothetical protein